MADQTTTELDGMVARARGNADPLTFLESSRRLGAYLWIESRLYEVVGSWAREAPEPEAKVLFDLLSSHHSWRADLWAGHMPRLKEIDLAELVRAPTPALEETLNWLEAPSETAGGVTPRGGSGETESLMIAHGRVILPRLAAVYRRHLARTSPASDAPLIRSLNIAASDISDDWAEEERALQGISEASGIDRDVDERAALFQDDLESRLATAGGLVAESGPVSGGGTTSSSGLAPGGGLASEAVNAEVPAE